MNGRLLYPNLYVVLTGPPGGGKTTAIRICADLLSSLQNTLVSPARVTNERFMQSIAEACQKNLKGVAAAGFIEELSTFIKPGDKDFIITLTALFDCPRVFLYETMTRKTVLENVFLSLLGGITPKGIAENVGRSVFGTGFTSRLNFICSRENFPLDLYAEPVYQNYDSFASDLKQINALEGKFVLEPKAKREIQNWSDEGMKPIPSDRRLDEYLARRSVHLLKLCMIKSASRSDELVIREADFEWAKSNLLEAEETMSIAFEFMGESGNINAINGICDWIKTEHENRGYGVSDQLLRKKLLEDIDPSRIDVVLEQMQKSGMIKIGVGQGTIAFFPGKVTKDKEK